VCEAETLFVEQTVGATWELNTVRLCRLWILRRFGVFAEIGECFDHYTRDAVRRGDLHMDTSVRWACNDVWLARDNPDAACTDLDSGAWLPPEGRFHLQHFYELRARTELDLYCGNARDTLTRLAPRFRALRSSMLLRVKDIHAETAYAVGRCALVMGDARRALRCAKTLANEGISFATVWAELLRAAVIEGRGDEDRAREQLQRVIGLASSEGMDLCATVARRRYAELVGGDEGDELMHNTSAWMAAQAIANPTRMTDLIAPRLAT